MFLWFRKKFLQFVTQLFSANSQIKQFRDIKELLNLTINAILRFKSIKGK